ncbi:MAG: hypothetical protein BWY99_02749 [Synergistetes bacterium ADurb.BinA166]|nr:MAG: hypothetical protein BWY99_02749 [Synergistetes bacterium ADurb.BinA166]
MNRMMSSLSETQYSTAFVFRRFSIMSFFRMLFGSSTRTRILPSAALSRGTQSSRRRYSRLRLLSRSSGMGCFAL